MLAAKWLKVELQTCEKWGIILKELIFIQLYSGCIYFLKKPIWYIDIVERYIMIGMFVIMDKLI